MSTNLIKDKTNPGWVVSVWLTESSGGMQFPLCHLKQHGAMLQCYRYTANIGILRNNRMQWLHHQRLRPQQHAQSPCNKKRGAAKKRNRQRNAVQPNNAVQPHNATQRYANSNAPSQTCYVCHSQVGSMSPTLNKWELSSCTSRLSGSSYSGEGGRGFGG